MSIQKSAVYMSTMRAQSLRTFLLSDTSRSSEPTPNWAPTADLSSRNVQAAGTSTLQRVGESDTLTRSFTRFTSATVDAIASAGGAVLMDPRQSQQPVRKLERSVFGCWLEDGLGLLTRERPRRRSCDLQFAASAIPKFRRGSGGAQATVRDRLVSRAKPSHLYVCLDHNLCLCSVCAKVPCPPTTILTTHPLSHP